MVGVMRREWGRAPLLATLVVLAAAVWVTVRPPYTNGPPIRSDGLGYYAWTDAIVDGDFDFCQWAPALDAVGALSANNPNHPSRCENKYPAGLALLRFPVMGPLAAIESGSHASPSTVSGAEEKASQWLSVAALLATVLLLGATLRRLRVRPVVADLTVLAAVFGTGVFHYATYDGSFTHVYAAGLFAALLFAGVRAADMRERPHPIVLFALSLFIALMREPDVVVLLILVAAWILWRGRTLGSAGGRVRFALSSATPVLAALILAEGWQLLYNHWSSGRWTLSSYGAETFTLAQHAERHVLLSYNHGLLTWYPVLGVFLIAALIPRPARWWGLVALVGVAALDVIYGSWEPWWLGGAFGMRGFVDIVPLIAVAGGVGLASLRTAPRLVLLGAAAVCVVVTLELMHGYWAGAIPFEFPTPHQYWEYATGARSLLHG